MWADWEQSKDGRLESPPPQLDSGSPSAGCLSGTTLGHCVVSGCMRAADEGRECLFFQQVGSSSRQDCSRPC